MGHVGEVSSDQNLRAVWFSLVMPRSGASLQVRATDVVIFIVYKHLPKTGNRQNWLIIGLKLRSRAGL